MAEVVRLTPGLMRLAPDRPVLKAADYQDYLAAQALIEAAKAEAEAIRARAQAAYAEERARGYADGRAEAEDQVADRFMEASEQILEYLAGLEMEMAEIVHQAVEKVLGELDETDLVQRVVRHALRQARDQKRVLIRVAIGQGEAIQAQLDELLRGFAEIGALDVTEDPRVRPGGCLLETPMGVVDARLETQLENLRQRLTQRFASR